VTAVVVDTSVVIKWFHAEGESEVVEARALLAAHRDEVLTEGTPPGSPRLIT
jgi:predicted nucleic acid-binding protein